MKFRQSPRRWASSSTSTSMFFSHLSLLMVRRHVSFGLPGLRQPSGVHFSAWLGNRWSGIRRAWPYQRHRWYLILSVTDLWPLLARTSSSLMWSFHLMFSIVRRQLLSNLLTHNSMSRRPFHNSHPYSITDILKQFYLCFFELCLSCCIHSSWCWRQRAPYLLSSLLRSLRLHLHIWYSQW